MMQPILAAALLQAPTNGNEMTACTPSGFEGIDEALQGGLSSGCVTSVSGEHGTGKTLVR
jgi:RecA/RadA recombinase